MISSYLIDTSGIWQILRDRELQMRWIGPIEAGLLKVCAPTRLEYLYSAESPAGRDEMESELTTLFEGVAVPKDAWRWAENAQYKLTQKGQHRGPGPVDLVLCATAVHHGLTLLHADNDFAATSRILPEVVERDIRRTAPPRAD
ncbi:PIN domain-containing protein [Streptomyces sp. NPDC020766]|uniref:PIN domain-containing protein n=1 Tax=Streptomyces sp. NPDC020766 TaxID=3155011 RepID=UPI0033FD65E9